MKKYDDRLVPARDIRPSGALAETTIGIGLEGVSVRSAIRSFPGQVVTLARAVKCGKIVALLTARPDSRLRVATGGEGLFECFGIGSASDPRSEEHTSELQSLMRISYAVFCLKKKNQNIDHIQSDM